MSALNIPISVYRSAYDNKGYQMLLEDFLQLGSTRFRNDILTYRRLKGELAVMREELGENDADTLDLTIRIDNAIKEADRLKRGIPCATLSGLFSPTRSKLNLSSHSGYICIDIDDHFDYMNAQGEHQTCRQSLAQVPDLLRSLPYVRYASHSVGGVGYFALVRLGEITTQHPHEWYFECLQDEFEKMGIVIDRACRDVTRLRFASYDENVYVNEDAEPYLGFEHFLSLNERKRQEAENRQREAAARQRAYQQLRDPDEDYRHVALCCQKIAARRVNIAEDYNTWKEVGFALATAFGERGREFFHTISAQSAKYDAAQNDRKYDNLLRSNRGHFTIATLFAVFKQNGIFWYKE